MLVLSRKANETIRVGENVTITILKSKGNTVRLGIEAPRDVRVMRGEILARDSSDDQVATESIAIEPPADSADEASEVTASDSANDAEAACTRPLAFTTRCEMEPFRDSGEDTRCASDSSFRDRRGSRCDAEDGYEGDCWTISSMQRRVRKVAAARK